MKREGSMLERRDLTKKGGLRHELFSGLVKGERGVHDGCSRILASSCEKKVGDSR